MALDPTGKEENQATNMVDLLMLMNSDYPGMSLTNMMFDGTNYLTWSRRIERALIAKMKISFIDDTEVIRTKDSTNYARWRRCDSMVGCWITNSMTKEISGSFARSESARALWLDIGDRYHESNAPLIYQLQQELSQDRMSKEHVAIGQGVRGLYRVKVKHGQSL